MAVLKESGPVPGDANGVKGAESAKKKRRPDKGVSPVVLCPESDLADDASLQIDMDKLADNLQKMSEDDLLAIVQMIHDKKSPETMTKNDVDRKRACVPLWSSARNANVAVNIRRRVPCRSVYAPRQLGAGALGLHV